jgi:triacylglycerol esterase/lipase EstA (alpha/beta hydrolase family)
MRIKGMAAAGLVMSMLTLGSVAASAAFGPPDYTPVDRPGPPLSVPGSMLSQALVCTGDLRHATRTPILLVPGTGSGPKDDFSWNWERALAAQAWPFCTIELPGNSMADIQVAGEYIVYSIRTMHRVAHRKIDILGHSQGGMVQRWALRFWPDTRAMVDDLVGLAPSNHGSLGGDFACTPSCSAAFWQQRKQANFIAALNSRQETFPGISYTVIYTHTDWVVTPNLDSTGSSSLHGGGGAITNVAIQDVCPQDLTEHLGMVYDGPAYALAIDALTHAGPANPSRVPLSVCFSPLQPVVNPLTFPIDSAGAAANLANTIATYPRMSSEPPLACYVTATCP